MNANNNAAIDEYIRRADQALCNLAICRLGLDGIGAFVQASMLQQAVCELEGQLIAIRGEGNVVAGAPSEIEQLVSLIEARQFPIGANFTDPLASRLYDAWAAQTSVVCELTDQLGIATKRMKKITTQLDKDRAGCDWSCISTELKCCLADIREQQGDSVAVRLNKRFSNQVRAAVGGFSPRYVLARLIKLDADMYQELESRLDDFTDEEFDEEERRGEVLRQAIDLIWAFAGNEPVYPCRRCGGDRHEFDCGFDEEEEQPGDSLTPAFRRDDHEHK